jgi:hypothetical protein
MKDRAFSILVTLTSVLLGGYFSIVVWAWLSPTTDPQAGMAVGFLMLVTFFQLGLAALLVWGAVRRRAGAVWTVFAVCALPSLSLVARGIYLLVRWIEGRP